MNFWHTSNDQLTPTRDSKTFKNVTKPLPEPDLPRVKTPLTRNYCTKVQYPPKPTSGVILILID